MSEAEGKVFLVGGGPGDPGLITVRGRELLARAEVVIYDRLISPQLLDYAPAEALKIYAGKASGEHTRTQEEIQELLIFHARRGKRVVRLKGGDPFVFGRGGEEALALAEAGIPFEVVPGVTAGLAAMAYAGIPATHRNVSDRCMLINGHGADAETLADLTCAKGTLVFYMGVEPLEFLCGQLLRNGMSADTPAAIIQQGTLACQKTVVAALGDIALKGREADVQPPALLVVGEVVRLRESLQWFERGPLFGRRVAVTRAKAQSASLAEPLRALGAEVIDLPTVRIDPPADASPLRESLMELASFDWIVFTSVNSIEVIFSELNRLGLDARAFCGVRVAVVGPACRGRLESFGLVPDAQPDSGIGGAIVAAISAREDLAGKKLLLPRSDLATSELPEALRQRGAIPREVVAYQTQPEEMDGSDFSARLQRRDVDWIVFASPSAVEFFMKRFSVEAIRASAARLVSIGPSTSATIRGYGLECVEASPHTCEGLVQAILQSS